MNSSKEHTEQDKCQHIAKLDFDLSEIYRQFEELDREIQKRGIKISELIDGSSNATDKKCPFFSIACAVSDSGGAINCFGESCAMYSSISGQCGLKRIW